MSLKDIRVLVVALIGFVIAVPAVAQDAEDSGSAPLVIASDSGAKIEFQVGADLFGGGMDDVDFIGGVNATFVYPVFDWFWVGIRPSLHYLFLSDSPYDETWTHADVAMHFNILNDPVRVYALVAGGYAFALDSDTPDLSHGYSVAGGVGVAWRPDDSILGLFCEIGFRYGAASSDVSQLVLDPSGNPIYDEANMIWETEIVERDFELMTVTINLGLTISP